MSDRESTLRELGVLASFTSVYDDPIKGCIGPQAFVLPIPTLSGFGDFTPISVRSYTIAVTDNAHMESD